MIKTYTPRASEVTREWHVLDATGHTLGRLATQVATILRGKHKPTYTPHMDMGYARCHRERGEDPGHR